MTKWLAFLVLILALASGCKAPNEAFCCLTAADCEAHGVTGELRPCDDGLACKSNECMAASCSTDGCAASAPTCDTSTDVCVGCTTSAECARFPDADVCDLAAGSCVECIGVADCEDATRPICEDGTCRGCRVDSECESGACSDDGECNPETDTVYLSPSGVDEGLCTRAAPCKQLRFALATATTGRNHIVFASGSYSMTDVSIHPSTTRATSLHLHGGGAILNGGSEPFIGIRLPTTLRDLELNSLGSVTLSVESAGAVTLERLKLTGGVGMSVEGPVTVRDISITASGTAIQLLSGASLVLERAVLRGGQRGIESTLGVTVDISNTVIADTSNIAVDLANATGAMRFVTITNSGNSSSGASGLACNVYYPPGLSVTSTIVWTPNTSKPPISGMCRLSSTIAGPIGVVGASNIDPMFTAQDWHLSPNSPARDMATTGPALDFEGDPRPNGTGFDIGADETR